MIDWRAGINWLTAVVSLSALHCMLACSCIVVCSVFSACACVWSVPVVYQFIIFIKTIRMALLCSFVFGRKRFHCDDIFFDDAVITLVCFFESVCRWIRCRDCFSSCVGFWPRPPTFRSSSCRWHSSSFVRGTPPCIVELFLFGAAFPEFFLPCHFCRCRYCFCCIAVCSMPSFVRLRSSLILQFSIIHFFVSIFHFFPNACPCQPLSQACISGAVHRV